MSRGLNLNNSNSKLISAADYGGQRLLGLNYSLTNWINTGNMAKIDSFEKTETKNKTTKNKKEKKFNLQNAIKITIAALGLAAAGILIFKNKNKLKNSFESPDLKNKFNELSENIKNIFKRNTSDAPVSFTDSGAESAEIIQNAVENTDKQDKKSLAEKLIAILNERKEALKKTQGNTIQTILNETDEAATELQLQNANDAIKIIERFKAETSNPQLCIEAPKPQIISGGVSEVATELQRQNANNAIEIIEQFKTKTSNPQLCIEAPKLQIISEEVSKVATESQLQDAIINPNKQQDKKALEKELMAILKKRQETLEKNQNNTAEKVHAAIKNADREIPSHADIFMQTAAKYKSDKEELEVLGKKIDEIRERTRSIEPIIYKDGVIDCPIEFNEEELGVFRRYLELWNKLQKEKQTQLPTQINDYFGMESLEPEVIYYLVDHLGEPFRDHNGATYEFLALGNKKTGKIELRQSKNGILTDIPPRIIGGRKKSQIDTQEMPAKDDFIELPTFSEHKPSNRKKLFRRI